MVKLAGIEADYSPSNSNEIKIKRDIPALPLYDWMEYNGTNYILLLYFNILSYKFLGLPCGLFF